MRRKMAAAAATAAPHFRSLSLLCGARGGGGGWVARQRQQRTRAKARKKEEKSARRRVVPFSRARALSRVRLLYRSLLGTLAPRRKFSVVVAGHYTTTPARPPADDDDTAIALTWRKGGGGGDDAYVWSATRRCVVRTQMHSSSAAHSAQTLITCARVWARSQTTALLSSDARTHTQPPSNIERESGRAREG